MNAITFRGAYIRYADVRFSDNNEPYVRLHMAADWTDVVREAMEWEDIPDCAKGAVKLKADISPHNFTLDPPDKKLRDHRIDIAISTIGDFALITKDGEQEGSSVRLLNFVLKAQASEDSALAISNYMHRIGPTPGLMKVRYAKQMTLGEGVEESSAETEEDETDEDAAEETGETYEDPRTTTITHRRGRRSAGGTA